MIDSKLINSIPEKPIITAEKDESIRTAKTGILYQETTNAFNQKMDETFLKHLGVISKINYTISSCNGKSDVELMVKQIRHLIENNSELIFTTAPIGARIAKIMLREMRRFIPIVFGGIANPVELKFIDSIESSHNNVTGITGTGSVVGEQISQLPLIKPDIQTVLLLFDPSSRCGTVKQEAKQHNPGHFR